MAACQIAEQREELRELDTARDLAEKLKAANENTETALAIGDAHRTQREDAAYQYRLSAYRSEGFRA